MEPPKKRRGNRNSRFIPNKGNLLNTEDDDSSYQRMDMNSWIDQRRMEADQELLQNNGTDEFDMYESASVIIK